MNNFDDKLASALLKFNEDFSPSKGQELNFRCMSRASKVYYHTLPKPVKDAISRIPDIISYEDIRRIYKYGGYYYVETRSGPTIRFDERGKYQFDTVDIDGVDFDQPVKSQGRVKIE